MARSSNCGLGTERHLRSRQGAPLEPEKTATRRPRPLLSKCIASSISISIPCTFLYLFLCLPSVNYVATCVGVRLQRRLPECARFRVLGTAQNTAVGCICRSIRISHRPLPPPLPLPLPRPPPLPLPPPPPLFCSTLDSADVTPKESRGCEDTPAVRVVHCGHSRLATEARAATATKEWRSTTCGRFWAINE